MIANIEPDRIVGNRVTLVRVADLQDVLDAVQSPTRREILALVWDGQLTVGEIASAFELRAPTISQHLKVLREAGLVTLTADGNFRRYQADQAALRALHAAIPAAPTRWIPADDLPETRLATASTTRVVVASVEVPTDQATTYAAFADPETYSRWLGVPVSIVGGRFACTMEWGTRIRGRYEVEAAPSLIAMRWDFEDDNVPVPGGEMVGYLRFTPSRDGCVVEVHQLCHDDAAAEFMEVAWSMVLGRLREGVVDAVGARRTSRARATRPKRSAPVSSVPPVRR